MKIINLQLKIALLLLFMCFKLSAEKILDAQTLEQAKAHYLLEIIKHITQKPEKDPIVIGLLDKNELLHDAIKQKISEVSVRNKTLSVHNIPKQSNRKNYYSVVLVTNKKFNNIPALLDRFGSVLVVVDGRVDKAAQLVSLVNRNRQIKIELNLQNLVQYKFEVSNELVNFAGTKEDLAGQLNQKQIRLQNLIEDAEIKHEAVKNISQTLTKKNAELDQIKTTLIEKNKVLSQNISKLNKSKSELQTLQDKMHIEQTKIAENKTHMLQQKRQLESKIAELSVKEQTLKKLNKNIDINKDVLKQQNTELQKKKEIINKKEQTISEQRILLFLAISAIVIISIFVYSTVRLSRMQKKANNKLNRLNDQLYELATTDSMTQLFNRRHFIESAQLQIVQLQRTEVDGAVLMLDIDDFKNVNDTFGHAMGDEAIIQVASILKNNLREYDFVGRIGGEEYAMLLSSCELDKANQIAERIRKKIAELLISHQQNTIKLTISIGLTMIQKDDKDIEKTLQRADAYLYKAKSIGKNRVVSS